MSTIRLLLADDHAVLRAGLKALLATQADLQTVGEAGDGDEAVRVAEAILPDVVLLDVTMPGNEQLAALVALRTRVPNVRVLLLTMHGDPILLREALRLGAAGYILKQAAESELLSAIRAVARGEAYVDSSLTRSVIDGYLRVDLAPTRSPARSDGLSKRETEVLALCVEGYRNNEIAARLFVSVRTIETHKAHIAEKLSTRSRVDWLRYAREKGLVRE